MKYVEWVEEAWRAVCEQAREHPFPNEATIRVNNLAGRLDIDPHVPDHSAALAYVVLVELPGLALLKESKQSARMTDEGWGLCGQALAPYFSPGIGMDLPEEERHFLSRCVELMEDRHDRFAFMGAVQLDAARIIVALGWDPDDRLRTLRIARSLHRKHLITADERMGSFVKVRPTYQGVLRETG